jgi:hypothetical protein
MNNNQTSISHRYKLLNPCRNQIEMQLKCLDDLLPREHKARAVWEFIDKMDLNISYQEIVSYYNQVGRPTTSPKILLSLWIYSDQLNPGIFGCVKALGIEKSRRGLYCLILSSTRFIQSLRAFTLAKIFQDSTGRNIFHNSF